MFAGRIHIRELLSGLERGDVRRRARQVAREVRAERIGQPDTLDDQVGSVQHELAGRPRGSGEAGKTVAVRVAGLYEADETSIEATPPTRKK